MVDPRNGNDAVSREINDRIRISHDRRDGVVTLRVESSGDTFDLSVEQARKIAYGLLAKANVVDAARLRRQRRHLRLVRG